MDIVTLSKIELTDGVTSFIEPFTISIRSDDRIGLVGINGSGKTSLLRGIIGKNKNMKGKVYVNCKIEYVPQIDLDAYRSNEKVYEYIAKHIENWWDVFTYIKENFRDDISESIPLHRLSGGELVKINLAIAVLKKPQLLLLDEPTNHLDRDSIEKLSKLLLSSSFAYVVVSHNRKFLNEATKSIWEIENHTLKIYGGNYDFYLEEKRMQKEALERELVSAKKDLRKAEKIIKGKIEKFDKSQEKIDKLFREQDRSLSRGAMGSMKELADIAHGEEMGILGKKIGKLNTKIKEIAVKERKRMFLDLKDNSGKGMLIRIRNGKLYTPDRQKLLLEEISFDVSKTDRISISGKNGSGKTVFINTLSSLDKSNLEGDTYFREDLKFVFVNQKYDIVSEKLSLIDNLRLRNPSLGIEDTRRYLSNLGFKTELEVNKYASELSGGETARLAFSVVTSMKPDILVLDEPTNNLDIETVEYISEALNVYEGTLIVISHDVSFIDEIGIERRYELKDKHLKEIEK
jgi:ATPase subunit of ABC transporter with duplicated ATPase domains